MSKQTGPVSLPQELLDFYDALLDIQQKYLAKSRELHVFSAPEQWVWDETNPLVASIKPVIDPVLARELFNQLLELLACHKPVWVDSIKKLEGMTERDFSDLIVSFLEGDRKRVSGIISRLDIQPEVAEFVVFQTFKPFLRAYAEAASLNIDIENWLENFCPVCGNRAKIAVIRGEEGKRYLRCSHCETEWLYKLLACPNCGNNDHQTLSFLLIEETPGYRLDVCEVCKSYLKTIDARAGLKPNMDTSEIQTIYLDIIAHERGYSNRAVNA